MLQVTKADLKSRGTTWGPRWTHGTQGQRWTLGGRTSLWATLPYQVHSCACPQRCRSSYQYGSHIINEKVQLSLGLKKNANIIGPTSEGVRQCQSRMLQKNRAGREAPMMPCFSSVALRVCLKPHSSHAAPFWTRSSLGPPSMLARQMLGKYIEFWNISSLNLVLAILPYRSLINEAICKGVSLGAYPYSKYEVYRN